MTNLPVYNSIFDEIDLDKSGEVDIFELKSALQSLKIKMDDATLGQLIKIVNITDKPSMNRSEFCHFLYIFENADPKNVPQILFLAADSDYSGAIDFDEFKFIISKLDSTIPDEHIQYAIEKMGVDGKITQDIFLKIIGKLID